MKPEIFHEDKLDESEKKRLKMILFIFQPFMVKCNLKINIYFLLFFPRFTKEI